MLSAGSRPAAANGYQQRHIQSATGRQSGQYGGDFAALNVHSLQ